jgi:hypothetical protein
MENEKAPEMFVDTLHTDIYPSFIDPLCETLNYKYLGSLLEKVVEELPAIVSEEIRVLPLSENNLLHKKNNNLVDLSPKKMGIRSYCQILKKTYGEKIKIQQELSILGRKYQEDCIEFSSFCQKGRVLIKKGLTLEPTFFAITLLAKQQVDNEVESIIEKYGDFLSNDEISLLYIPLYVDFFTKKFLDVQNFLENPSTEKKGFLEKRYGRGILDTPWFKQQKLDIVQKKEVENRVKQNFCKKYYFLLERKIPNLEVIDYILTMDHVVDKHIQANTSFMHDIFLQMQILNGKGRISGIKDKEKIKDLISRSIKELLTNY